MNFLYQEETYSIIGCAIEVHKVLGSGFLEAVYHEALEIEFNNNFVQYESEKNITVVYKGVKLNKIYKSDFVCYDKIIVEIKATSFLSTNHEAQLLNYLKASSFRIGLLFNFGSRRLEYKRIIL